LSWGPVRTLPGAAPEVARLTPLAINPGSPETIRVSTRASATEIRDSVSEQLQLTTLATSLLVAFLGAAAITFSTIADVSRRTPELGLRRAVGATPRDIVILILGETSMAGMVAGVVGAWLGLFGSTLAVVALGWQPVFDGLIWLVLPLIGIVVGAVAGIPPAVHAARTSPRAALVS